MSFGIKMKILFKVIFVNKSYMCMLNVMIVIKGIDVNYYLDVGLFLLMVFIC